MIKEFFPDLVQHQKVEAIIIFDNSGKIVEQWTVANLNPQVIQEMCDTFYQIFALIKRLNYDFDELAIPFDRGVLYARLRSKFYLAVLARLSVDISLLRLITNVRLVEFESSKKGQKILKKLPELEDTAILKFKMDDVETELLKTLMGVSKLG